MKGGWEGEAMSEDWTRWLTEEERGRLEVANGPAVVHPELWLGFARSLAASREKNAQEKISRIEYQNIVYEVCNLLDQAFSFELGKGQGTTVDEVVPGVTKLRAERDASREEVELVQTGRENIHAYCDHMGEQHGREVTELKKERDASRALVARLCRELGVAADSLHRHHSDGPFPCERCAPSYLAALALTEKEMMG